MAEIKLFWNLNVLKPYRWVFHVHLEKAVLIAVAGENGRITIQDFWHHGGKDVLQLESYGQDGERSKS